MTGALLLGVGVGAVGLGSRAVTRRLLPDWSGGPLSVATIVISASVVVGVAQLLGVVGLFARLPVLAGLVASGTALWLFGRSTPRSQDPTDQGSGTTTLAAAPPPVERSQRATAAFAGVAVVAVAAEWCQRTWWALNHGIHTIDSIWYHLPLAARWVQTGSITPLHYLEGESLTTFFPGNGSIFHALGMMYLGNDLLSVFLNLAWLSLGLLAAWCIGRPFGAPRLTLGAAAVAFATPSLLATQPGGAYNDTMGIALVLASLAVFVSMGSGDSRSHPSAVAIAAAAAGMALGTKFQFLVPVAALTLGVICVTQRGRRVRHGLVWIGTLGITGSYWYLRNWIIVGNPLPAMDLSLGPIHLHKTPIFTPFTTFGHHMTNGAAWRDWFWTGFDQGIGGLWWLLLGGLVALVTLGLVRGGPLPRMICFVGGATMAGFVVSPAILGYGDNLIYFVAVLRYLAPGIVLCSVAAAAVAGEAEAVRRWLTMGVLTAYLVAIQMDASDWPERLEAQIDRPFWYGASLTWLAITTLLVVLALMARRLAPALDRRWFTIGAIAVIGVVGVGSLAARRTYLMNRYDEPQGILAWTDFTWAKDLSGERIGIIGVQLQYPLYGADQSNYVQYLGLPGPRSGWIKIGSCEAWRATINSGEFTYIAILHDLLSIGGERETAWTGSDPAAEAVYSRPNAQVFRITGPMDPSACTTPTAS